ncbi:MAG: prolyl oligopeptidase family serine peptidase [Vicinamibacteria bacterium]|nr:prolyl oligopeptidase family serine peptidase [Vicinamibacteria bacterium]
MFFVVATVLALPPLLRAEDTAYRLPPPALQKIVDAPRPPRLVASPGRDLAALLRPQALPGIAFVAQPELRLAGVRINPRTYAQSRFNYVDDLWLIGTSDGRELRLSGLPQPLDLADLRWSPDQRHIALSRLDAASGQLQLWIVDVATRAARRLELPPLNAVFGTGFEWLPGPGDGARLLVRLRPAGQGAPPASDGIPTGPNSQQTEVDAGQRQIRTFQDLLRNEQDARTFEHFAQVQLAMVDLAGAVTPLGAPAMYLRATPSPDGRLILTDQILRPFSYLSPASWFPRRVEVIDLRGERVHTVAELPLVEGLPNGNDAVRAGVRNVEWRADAPATLAWVEAQDGGDPAVKAEVRDQVSMLAAPFTGAPQVLARLSRRVDGIHWGRGDVALVTESWWKDRSYVRWRVAPDAPARAPEKLHAGSTEDRYADPGEPVQAPDAAGNPRLLFSPDGRSVYFTGAGASAEGDRPFLDRLELATKKTERLFRSEAPWYERPVLVLDPAARRIVTSRESPAEPANFQLRVADKRGRFGPPLTLTRFPHPTPELEGIRKEQIRYKRADGVELTATLYLPAGYDVARDGRLPFLLWAYPQEFKSAAAASQVTDSPYRFNAVSYWGPLPFLAQGYGVLDDPAMPIVGEGDTEPNDTYVQQLTASAQAAIDEIVRRGVADRERIAVGGHSYGAFMTANLLAHTRLFKAGIARSGAYNRTLTPFGFQSEERNYWQAADTYDTMSPFHHADRIQDALLMIHGEQDNNSGTFPIQSERMFAALKGLGGKARLVMLPNESHGYRARESILHMLAETHDWLEKYVKGAPAR